MIIHQPEPASPLQETPPRPDSWPHLYIVLPAYNEGAALTDLVRGFAGAIRGYPFHIFVVDDGSSDDSMAHLQAAQIPHVSIIPHLQNKGLGEALKTGFQTALAQAWDHDLVVVMDSDGTHPPALIERMAQLAREGNDVVVASRYRYGSRVVGLDAWRLFLSHAASWTFRLSMPIPNIKDYTCGFRVYRVGVLRRAFDTYGDDFIREAGFSCMAEVLIKLHRLGALCCEVPMILRYDQKVSTSKIRILRTIARSLGLVVRQGLGR